MLIRFRIVSLSPPLSFFSSSYLVSFFCFLLACIFLTCEFYDGGILMLTTFPFYRAKQTQNNLFYSSSTSFTVSYTIHCYYYYNSAYILLQSFIPISLAFLLCIVIPFHSPFSVAIFEHYFDACRIFFQSAICSHNTYFRPYKFSFLVFNITTQFGIPQTDTLHPKN